MTKKHLMMDKYPYSSGIQVKLLQYFILYEQLLLRSINQMTANAGNNSGKGDTYSFVAGVKIGTVTGKSVLRFFRKLGIDLPQDPTPGHIPNSLYIL